MIIGKTSKIFFFKTISAILLLIAFVNCSDNEELVATVGSHKITLEEFQKRYSEFLMSTGIKDNYAMRKGVLDNMINEIALFYYDDNREIFSDPEYQKEIKWLEKEALLAFVKDRDIYAKIKATDEEIRSAYYKAHVSLAARHLFARTKEEADNLYELLKAGADFGTLAKQVFTDSTLKANGGYLGYFTWGDMDPAFEEVAYSLKPGEISKPVQTAQGYSIIKLEDRKINPLMTEYDYLQRKKELERTLRISKKRPAEKEFIAKLFDRSKLSFDNAGLKVLLNALFVNKKIDELGNKDLPLCSYAEEEFSVGEIYRKLNEIPAYHLSKIENVNLLKRAVEGILIQDKLYKYALNKNYNRKTEVIETENKLKMNKFLQVKMKEIAENAIIPDSAVRNYYEENIPFFSEPRKINAQEIIVERKSLADSLVVLLKNGESFSVLAKKYSVRRWSAENDGFLGLSPVNSFGMIKDKLWNAELGKILGPFKIRYAYGIFRVTERTESKPIPFDKIKDQVLERMRLDTKTKLVTEYLNEKRKKIEINVYLKNLKYSNPEVS